MKFGRKYSWFHIIQIFNVIKKLRCIPVVVNRLRMFQIDERCWRANFETTVSECLKDCLNSANALFRVMFANLRDVSIFEFEF